jgi:putative ABC transport system permease protein
MNRGLLGEVVRMALETVRTNKMRSALTVLGVVIGITAIVGMTSLIRGFDESIRGMINELGPKTIFLARVGGLQDVDADEIARRPVLTVGDAKAIEKLAPSVANVDIWLGNDGEVQERIFYESHRTTPLVVLGATEQFAAVNFVQPETGRFFTRAEVDHRRRVVVLGYSASEALFGKSGLDPIGKKVRVGAIQFTVVGVLAKRPTMMGGDRDQFVVVPQTTHQVLFNTQANRGFRGGSSATIVIIPHEDATRDEAQREVEEIMRIRHGLTLNERNDFDFMTQDAILAVYDQVTNAVFLALVVISSIALMVGGIGVMAIMMISVTERTREIGVRKALGARRQEILVQFLAEAAFLTSIGGVLGIICGSVIGVAVNLATGFPISLPWWSFAMGLGFSASVGIFFGMMPAFRASRLDPIEALRYE